MEEGCEFGLSPNLAKTPQPLPPVRLDKKFLAINLFVVFVNSC